MLFEKGRKMSTSLRQTPEYQFSSKPSHRLLLMPLVLLPLLLGGARPWFWSVLAGAFAVGLVRSVWSRGEVWWTGNGSRKWLMGLGLLLFYPLFQSLPLSAFLIDHLSPHVMQWKTISKAVALAPSGFFSISYAPLISFFSALWWVFLAGYALLFRKVLREETSPNWLYHTLFWVAGIEAFYGLLQTLSPSIGVLWESAGQGVARGTFVNRNHYAAFLGMVWPVLLTYLLSMTAASSNSQTLSHSELEQQKRTGQKKWFLAFIVSLILLVLFFSQSRGGILGALIALTVFVTFGKRLRKKGMVSLLVGCWLVMFAYGSIIGFQEILVRFDLTEKDAPGRLEIWEDSWRMLQDHWLTGTGLGTFSEVIRVYQSHLTDKFDIVHAHNDYLELAGELGVPVGATMVILVWGYWWVCAIRIAKEGGSGSRDRDGYEVGAAGREQMENRRLLALGALAGSAAFLFHSWVEFNWQIPANELYFIVLLILMEV
jgi:O-antigen ligase